MKIPNLRDKLARFLPLVALALALGMALGAQSTQAAPAEQTEPRPVEPARCEVACKERVSTFLERCKNSGAADCEAQAREMHARCMQSCAPSTEPTDCLGNCSKRVRAWYQTCVDNGGENCSEQARTLMARCTASCEPDRPEPSDCKTNCSERVRAWYKTCVDSGREGCSEQAREMLARCTASCEPSREPVSCERSCRQRAQRYLASCEGPDCAARARTMFQRCVAACDTGSAAPGPRRPGIGTRP